MNPPRFNPFPGLRSFLTSEKHLFFGREAQTAEMLERLGFARFLAAVGPSGSGKSSLVRAGLIPELLGGTNTRAGSHWIVLVFRPGSDPVGALAHQLAECDLYGGEPENDAEQLRVTLRRSARGLVEAVRQANPPPRTNVLVVVDQFEELFRFANARTPEQETADAFVNLLLEASLDTASSIFVVLTMRSDFIGDCARFPGLAEAINRGQYLIPRLTRDQWRSAIEGPIRVGGGTIAPRLVQRLLNDVADDPDQLPVLQHALMRTWDNWERTTVPNNSALTPIDIPHYEAVGGMAEALSRHAEEALAELPEGRSREIAERLFKALTEKEPDGRGVRRPARCDVLQSATGASPEELEKVSGVFRSPGRTFILPGAEVPLQPSTVLDISHESLMRVWARLRGWVDEEAQSSTIYRRLEETARLWKEQAAALYRDPELALAVRWRDTHRPTPGWGKLQHGDFENALLFLKESERAAEREKAEKEAAQKRELALARERAAEQARRARAYRLVAAVMALLVIVTVFAALWLQRLRKQAVSRELAAQAVNQLEVDPEKSVALALQAMQTHPQPSSENVLRSALFASRVRQHLGTLGGKPLRFAEVSPDALRIATAGDSATPVLYRISDGQVDAKLVGHSAGITDLHFGPRDLIVTSSDDGSAILWESRTGKLLRRFTNSAASMRSAEWNKDGTLLLTADQNGTLKVWTGPDWTNSATLRGTDEICHGAILNPTGDRAFLIGENGSSVLWSIQSGNPPIALTNASPNLITALFSPNGERLATGSADGGVDLWDGRTGAHLVQLEHGYAEVAGQVALAFPHGGTDSVLSAQKSPFGAKIRNPRSREFERLFVDYTGAALSTAFSPDDDFVLLGGEDKTARIWSRASGRGVVQLHGHLGAINHVAFGPEGRWVVTASSDGTARIWATETGTQPRLPLGPREKLSAPGAAFSLGGRWGLAVDNSPLRKAWRWNTASEFKPTLLASNVTHTAMSHDGQVVALFLAVGPREDQVRIWRGDSKQVQTIVTNTLPVSKPALDFDGTMLLWASAEKGAQFWVLTPSPHPISPSSEWSNALTALTAASFSSDHQWLATINGSDQILVWRISNPISAGGDPELHLARRIKRPSGETLKSVAMSPDGQFLVAANGDSQALLWRNDASAPDEPLWKAPHEVSINDVGFSLDHRFVVTASSDGAARIWRTDGGDLITTLQGAGEQLIRAAFSTDSGSLVTLGVQGRLRTFDTEPCLSTEHILGLARRRLAPSASLSSH